jgi:hypothetical protein
LPGLTTDNECGARVLAAMPLVAHPFALVLAARCCSPARAAALLGVSRWTVANWIAWRSSPPPWRAYEIAVAFGLDDDDELFPLPEEG